MGCIISGKSSTSSKKDIVHPEKKSVLENFSPKSKGLLIFFILFIFFLVEIKRKEDVDFSTADLVSEKSGKITKDYTILNPPLGKGCFINKNPNFFFI